MAVSASRAMTSAALLLALRRAEQAEGARVEHERRARPALAVPLAQLEADGLEQLDGAGARAHVRLDRLVVQRELRHPGHLVLVA